MEPQSHVIDRSRSPQKQGPQKQKGKKTVAEMKQPSELPKATKHISMDSDEEDAEPQNEHGTSSNSQPVVPVLPLHQGAAASSQGPATSSQGPSAITDSEDEETEDEDDEHGEQGARSQDSGRTVFYSDFYVLTNDEHWTVTPETHKYAAAAGSFCFDYRTWGTTGRLQLDHYAVGTTVIVP